MRKIFWVLLSVLCMCCAAIGLTGCKKDKHIHAFDKQVVTDEYKATDATCIEAAKYYYSCSCGEKGNETFRTGAALGHKFTNYVSDNNATCTQDGTKTAKCDRCEVTDTITSENSKLPHMFDKQVANEKYLASEATCTEAAKYYYSCTCGESEHDDKHTFASGTAKNHNYGTPVYTWSSDYSTCTATRVCKNDGNHIETETATATLTVTQQKSCVLDELSIYAANFKNSAFATQTKENIKTADKLNHDLTHHTAKAATCTEFGWYAYDTCTRCDYTTYREISALNHNYSTEWTIDIQPTCTEAGEKSHHCTRCDSRSGVTEIEKLGHSFTNYVSDNNATCTQDGTKTAKCDRCNETDTMADEGNKKNHTFDQMIVDDKYLYSKATYKNSAMYFKSCVCGAFNRSTYYLFSYGEPWNFNDYITHNLTTGLHTLYKSVSVYNYKYIIDVHSFSMKFSRVNISDGFVTSLIITVQINYTLVSAGYVNGADFDKGNPDWVCNIYNKTGTRIASSSLFLGAEVGESVEQVLDLSVFSDFAEDSFPLNLVFA